MMLPRRICFFFSSNSLILWARCSKGGGWGGVVRILTVLCLMMCLAVPIVVMYLAMCNARARCNAWCCISL